jgi:CheY-like chemotaxis protein
VFLSSRLEKYGIDAIYAADATQACRIAAKQRPSVIISDNVMPDGDAQYLLCRLRGVPATADIPVIVVTGRKYNEIDEQNLKRDICGWPGASQVFRKSFETHELFGALEKFCSFKKPDAAPDGMTETDARDAAGKPD